MTDRDGTNEPGGADELAAARDARGPSTEPLDHRGEAPSDAAKNEGPEAPSVTEDVI